MGRGPDKQPRKQRALAWTPPILVTEEEAVWMTATTDEIRSLNIVGSVSLHGKAAQHLYRYQDVESAIEARGGSVETTKLKENPIG